MPARETKMQARLVKFLGGAAAAALIGVAGPASAANFTWNTASNSTAICTSTGIGNQSGNAGKCVSDTDLGAAVGDVYSFNDGAGHLLTAEAFNATSGTLAKDFLGMYSGNGLGVGIASS